MRRELIEVLTMAEAIARAPWACHIVSVEGGFFAFESFDDYKTWANQK